MVAAEADGVAGERGEIGEERSEAVDGHVVVGKLARGLALGGRRRLGLGHGAGASSLGGGAVVVVEQHGGEGLTQVPFEVIGE